MSVIGAIFLQDAYNQELINAFGAPGIIDLPGFYLVLIV